MLTELQPVLPVAFAFSGLMYLWLAVRVSRSSPEAANSAVSFFLFLIGAMVIGSAFSYGATDPTLYGIGRTLSFFAGGFLPVVFYRIYREYTAGKAGLAVTAILCVIPVASTAIAITNPLHHMLWTIVETRAGLEFSQATDHFWFNSVHAPFAYTVFGYSLLALAGRLPTIARAHRQKILLLLVCAALPYAVSLGNTIFRVGPFEFPFTSSTLSLLLPLYWWAGVTLRVHEFSPLAYQTLFDHVRDPIIVLDKSQRIISANQPAQHLLKSDERNLVGKRLWDDLPEAKAMLDQVPDGDLTRTVRINTDRYFEMNSAPLLGRSGQNQGTVVVCRDVTERKQALRALADSEHLIRSLVEHSSNGILRFARDEHDGGRFRCTFANRAAEKFLGSGTGSVVGMPLEKLTLLEPRRLMERFGTEDAAAAHGVSYESEVETGEGEGWLRIVGEPVGQDFSVTLIDITERKRNETRILADALRDPLTGVLNRRGFEKAAPDSIRGNSQGAVLYLDLNHFKSINDRFGHPVGDALLKAFGHRLEFCLRPEDILARMGGDEFAIILPGVSVEDAMVVAERLVETASEAYIIQGQEISCTASVGIALMPRHGDELWHLVSVADQAMYNVKSISEKDAANDRAAYVAAAIAS